MLLAIVLIVTWGEQPSEGDPNDAALEGWWVETLPLKEGIFLRESTHRLIRDLGSQVRTRSNVTTRGVQR